MNNCEEYIDLMGKLCHLIKDGKVKTQEALDIGDRMAILWEKLNEEEQCYADEVTLRTRLWMGI